MADHDHDHRPGPLDALSRLAGPLVSTPLVPRPPVGELEHRARRRSGRRRATAAMAVLLVLVGIGGVLARAGTPDGSLATQSPSTTEPPMRFQGDLVIYLVPLATPSEVQAVRDSLVADPAVHRILYQTQAADYEAFRCLFADAPEMVQAVTPDMLPSTFRVFLDGDRAAIDRITADYAEHYPGVRDIIAVAKGDPPTKDQPDVFVLSTGTSLVSAPQPETTETSPTADCPVTGEWIK